ncbi:ribonucleoside triphosphate reductase [Candidatus Dojkabacteria bacterium]|nr:ribonucleoside triphosphate reductase [Candidatus Dojkabacteria bacterium]
MAKYNCPKVDVEKLIEKYLREEDRQVNENANIHYSYPGLTDYLSGELTKYYCTTKILSKKAAKAYDEGDIHIKNFDKHLVPYCAGWDLRKILKEGITGIPDKCSAGPAKHLQTALDHASRFILIICNEWAGAQAFSSLDTFMAPFIENDRLTFDEVKNCIQSFMYNLSISTRYGGQIPFSNITLDWTVPNDLKDEPAIIGGKLIKQTYGEFQREMNMFNKALIEVYMDGDYTGMPFPFPIPTYNITKDFDWDSENTDLLFEMTSKFGNPYFQNFVNSNLNPGDVRAMCCRLQMDMTKIAKKTGGRWASGASTGSIGVVEINMPRIGYLAKGDEVKYFQRLDDMLEISKEILEQKRKLVTLHMENGLTPYTKRYLGSFDHHFSTIGILGMNESLLNMWNIDISTKKGINFSQKVLHHIHDKMIDFQKETDVLYNLEATPAEGSSYRLAQIDKEKYPDIITAGTNDTPYYTNSTQLPVDYTDDIFEALDLQDKLQSTYSGGTVFHVFLGERLTNSKECKNLVRKIASNYKLPYFSITPTFSICNKHGYIKGEAKNCPHKDKDGNNCKEVPLVYSRVVGYYRPVKQWNKGKFEEYIERKEYKYCDTEEDLTKNRN